MKKKKKQQDHHHHHQTQHQQNNNHHHTQDNIELLKAVAQAWLSHSTEASTRPNGTEFDLRRINFHPKPTRFKLEAIKKTTKDAARNSWDFHESLLDTYEIVAVTKKLERGLVLDYELISGLVDDDGKNGVVKMRRRESSHSLRKLFNES